jgi:hypothetical protein
VRAGSYSHGFIAGRKRRKEQVRGIGERKERAGTQGNGGDMEMEEVRREGSSK